MVTFEGDWMDKQTKLKDDAKVNNQIAYRQFIAFSFLCAYNM